MRFAKAVVKCRIPILILTLILLIPSVLGMIGTRINYDMLTYLPEDMETVIGQNELMEDFDKGAFAFLIVEDTVRGLPPYVFIMIGLYSGLRREEALALQWDCVFLDASTPYISVRRAWRTEHNRPIVSTVLKTKAAKRDIPIPQCLVECLREAKKASISEYVIADSQGQPLSYSQFKRVWQYVVVRSTKERNYYKYVNGESIKYTVKPTLGDSQKNNPNIVYRLDFEVTPHQLRHTYITNLLYAGVDPKTVQYLAGHEKAKQLWTFTQKSSIISLKNLWIRSMQRFVQLRRTERVFSPVLTNRITAKVECRKALKYQGKSAIRPF